MAHPVYNWFWQLGSASSDGTLISLLPSSSTHWSLSCPLEPLRTNLSSDFPVSSWKWQSGPVFPRSSLSVPLIPTAPVSSVGPEMMRLLWHPLPCVSLPSERSPLCLWSTRLRAAKRAHSWAEPVTPQSGAWCHRPCDSLGCHHSLPASGSKVKPQRYVTCATTGPPFLCPVDSSLQNHFSGDERSVPHNCTHTVSPYHVQKNPQNPLFLISRGKSKDELCTCRP